MIITKKNHPFCASPLMTSPEPSLNLKGLFLSLDESNFSPVDAIMPGRQNKQEEQTLSQPTFKTGNQNFHYFL